MFAAAFVRIERQTRSAICVLERGHARRRPGLGCKRMPVTIAPLDRPAGGKSVPLYGLDEILPDAAQAQVVQRAEIELDISHSAIGQ